MTQRTPSSRETQIQQDVEDLKRLGYAQQLFREMGGFANFAISFSIISVRCDHVIGRRDEYGVNVIVFSIPPNELVLWTMMAVALGLLIYWKLHAKRTFPGPKTSVTEPQSHSMLV